MNDPQVPVWSGVVVRRARPEESADVAWLAALTFPLACPPGTPVVTMASHIATKLTPAVFRAWASSSTHALLVAAREEASGGAGEPDGSGVLGYALLVLGEPDGAAEADAVRAAAGTAGPYVELSKIYVRPDVQGAGVSDLLMSAAVDAAAELADDQGHRDGLPLWLGTNGLNARAQGFYRRHGFTTVGTRTYVVGGVEHDDVVMLHTADHG